MADHPGAAMRVWIVGGAAAPVACLLAVLILGCVENQDHGPKVSSGVPGNKTLDSLSQDDLAAVCKASWDTRATVESTPAYCTAAASCCTPARLGEFPPRESTDAEVQAACQRHRDNCVQQAREHPPVQPCSDLEYQNCPVTVAQVERCLTELLRNQQVFYESRPGCETLTVAQRDEYLSLLPTSDYPRPAAAPSCDGLKRLCMGLGRLGI